MLLAKFVYDGTGRRIESLTSYVEGVPQQSTHYYLSGQNQVLETREGSPASSPESLSPKYQNVWSPRYVDALVLRDSYSDGVLQPASRLYYLSDANYNVTALVGKVNDTWQTVERYAYTAYGKATIYTPDWSSTRTSSLYGNATLYTGRELDASTSLYYYRARYYSADLGSFVGRDPLGFVAGDENLYRYVGNEPTNATDPSGLWGDGCRKVSEDHDRKIRSAEEQLREAQERYRRNPAPPDPGKYYSSAAYDIAALQNRIRGLKSEKASALSRCVKGHSDFCGGDIFDYTAEDYGKTGPYRDPKRHFRPYQYSAEDAFAAIDACDADAFQRALHRLQDHFSHYGQGYDWPNTLGHVLSSAVCPVTFGLAGDNPDDANKHDLEWENANELTVYMVTEWKKNCVRSQDGPWARKGR